MSFFMRPHLYISLVRYSLGIIWKISKNGQLDTRNPVHTHMRAPAYIMRIYACFICPYVHLKNKINKNSKINIKISGHNTDTSGQMDVLLS